MTSTIDDEEEKEKKEAKKEKEKEKGKIQQQLQEMLLKQNYNFTGSSFESGSAFEPSSDKPIDEDKLTLEELSAYLVEKYKTCDKPIIHLDKINQIIGKDRASYLIKLNKSEYFKVLAHFSILSQAKRGWVNLLIQNSKISKPSLSKNPSFVSDKDSKKVNDAIIQCFYFRLLKGMTKQDKERYRILMPKIYLTTEFDNLLAILDKAIQDVLSFEKQNLDGYNNDDYEESLLPDSNLDETIKKTWWHLNQCLKLNVNEGYRTDTLRATLIKSASINRVINDIDAIINIQDQVLYSLPDEIKSLLHIKSISEILPAISGILNKQITDLPKDLIKCSKLVCKIYTLTSQPPKRIEEFNERHMMPDCIAVSAALLFDDFVEERKLNINIRGETNNCINIYNSLSDFSENIDETALDTLNIKTLVEYGFPEELFKYLTTRYSCSVVGLSDFYPSKIGAEAHLKVKKEKFQLQKEVYEMLKDMSVKDIYLWIRDFQIYVYGSI